ncbi:hypothetical protein [Enterococcus sp. BWR-S5]|uniref:hypothetical protein n=1 Tax=Enterococcus sp. BWR-S5 TaxID=2787714 RepID=UPI001922B371|nr:hypothetical protein [Enterococcus sp. BWR-S5]MBL1224585.1 hypothetical protein [Enterococcus sp. BWR-S5]MBL1224596.1 hypothetical protein [Enterococcus sp. BWR-S5]
MGIKKGKTRANVTLYDSSWKYLEKLADEKNKKLYGWDKKWTKSDVIEMLIENDKIIRRIEGKEL